CPNTIQVIATRKMQIEMTHLRFLLPSTRAIFPETIVMPIAVIPSEVEESRGAPHNWFHGMSRLALDMTNRCSVSADKLTTCDRPHADQRTFYVKRRCATLVIL